MANASVQLALVEMIAQIRCVDRLPKGKIAPLDHQVNTLVNAMKVGMGSIAMFA